ncbi:MAG: prolyl oligopeptidase family serine peptidase [Roseibacillus sp.]|nr:prolyl oligopeptidase family serine peptidase [Roseibacillus sp.]
MLSLHPRPKMSPHALLLILVTLTGILPLHAHPLLGKYQKHFANRWVGGSHGNIVYKIYAPQKLGPPASLPVVIYLHGSAKCGTDNTKQTKVAVPASFVRNFPQRPCILIAPQCDHGQAWMTRSGDSVLSLLRDFLREVKVADPKRVYLTGFSLGGYGVWHLIDKQPDLFAAAVPLAGAANIKDVSHLKDVSIWIFHGRRDKSVKVQRARDISNALKQKGILHKYSELPAGHLITSKIFNQPEIHEWLFRQKRK